MGPIKADPCKQAILGRWALAFSSLSVVLAALVALSGCDHSHPRRTSKDPIENAFKASPQVEYRGKAIVKLSFELDFSDRDVKGFSDQDLKKLKGMADLRSLEELDLQGTDITDGGLVYIKDCQNLQTLYLMRSTTDDGLAELEPLSALRHLDLRQTRITDRGLAHIARLVNLEELVLMKTNISDEGAKHLENLHKLQTLDIGDTRLGDQGVQSLAHLQELRTLFLIDTQVGDAAAGSLATLRNLEFLRLEGTQVSDRALPALGTLPKLRVLDLMGTRVTQRGVDELRRALPKTAINYESHPDKK